MFATNHMNAEVYRITGTLSADRIEALIDLEGNVDSAICSEANLSEANLSEARAGFPDEDFLATVVRSIRQLATKLRGENKSHAKGLADELEDIQSTCARAAEYGREELAKAVKLLDSLS